jgi:hypothetical protein
MPTPQLTLRNNACGVPQYQQTILLQSTAANGNEVQPGTESLRMKFPEMPGRLQSGTFIEYKITTISASSILKFSKPCPSLDF